MAAGQYLHAVDRVYSGLQQVLSTAPSTAYALVPLALVRPLGKNVPGSVAVVDSGERALRRGHAASEIRARVPLRSVAGCVLFPSVWWPWRRGRCYGSPIGACRMAAARAGYTIRLSVYRLLHASIVGTCILLVVHTRVVCI